MVRPTFHLTTQSLRSVRHSKSRTMTLITAWLPRRRLLSRTTGAKSKSSEVASCFDGNKQGCLRTIAPLSNLKDLPAPNMRRQNGGNSDE